MGVYPNEWKGPQTRMFNGKRYRFYRWHKHKHAAQQAAYYVKKAGGLARITRDKVRMGWIVWFQGVPTDNGVINWSKVLKKDPSRAKAKPKRYWPGRK